MFPPGDSSEDQVWTNVGTLFPAGLEGCSLPQHLGEGALWLRED